MATNPLQEFIARWTQPPLSYILIIIIIIVIAFLIFRRFYKSKSEHFKGESIEYVIKELNIKKQFKFSRKCKNGKLFYNLGIEKIRRVMFAKVKLETETDKKNMKYDISKEFIMFKTGSWLSEIPILSWFSKPDFFMINNDIEFIIKDKYSDAWTIKPSVYVHRFAEIWICSHEGKELLTEMIYKRMYENSKEIEMNTPKRFVFYNDIYASKLTVMEVEHKLESEKYNKRIERETGVKK